MFNMMLKLKRNKLELLKALKDLVQESLDFTEINGLLESEVSEMLVDMKEKRRVKKLKVMSKELDKWIKEYNELITSDSSSSPKHVAD